MGRKRSDDETTKSTIELVGCCAEEFGIRTSDVLVSSFAVLDVTILPIGETVGIGHLSFAEAHGFGERADSAFAAFSERSCIRVLDSISVRATVAGAHDDAFITGEFATEMVKREGWFYFCHMSNNLGSHYYVLSTKAVSYTEIGLLIKRIKSVKF